MLNHLQATELFSKYGIQLEGKEYASLDEAAKAIREGGTYFLKLVSDSEEATHKTEFGYVAKITNTSDLEEAWEKMTSTANSHGHTNIRFVLQEARSGHEVMIGAKRDPIFGFQIIFTPEGGKYAEIFAKVAHPSVRVGRLDAEEALAMITEHPLSPKITGARGEASVDLAVLADLLVKISRLMEENTEVWAIDLNPVFAHPQGINLVDARIETGPVSPVPKKFHTNRNLSVFRHPKRVLAVLASAKSGAVGDILLKNMARKVKDICVMLPTGKGRDNLEEMGVPIFDEVPDGCDLLVYAGIPADAPEIVSKFREKGGKGAAIISSDFSETGNVELEERLREAAGDMPYTGPNGLGIYSGSLNTFFIADTIAAYPDTGGSVGLFSQSGGLCLESFCEFLFAHRVPVNEVLSLGNGSGMSFTEILNSVADNEDVKLTVIHLEGGLKEGEGLEFIKAMKKATKVKPVIVLPAGLSEKGRKTAASHTGRMTGGADALMAALKQGGAIVADSEEQTRLALWMICTMPRATGKAVILTTGGGKGVLATDLAERVGLELREKMPPEFSEAVRPSMPSFADPTQNPFDFTGSVTLDGMLAILEHAKVLNSPGIFHVVYQVPGTTLLRDNGNLNRLDVTEAVERLAAKIEEKDLPLILNICAHSDLAREIETKLEKYSIVVTRPSPADLILRSLKLTMEVWKRYPEADLRVKKLPKSIESDLLTASRT